MKLRILIASMAIGSLGILLLAGCHGQPAANQTAATPPTGPAPNVQSQVQAIDNNPHIPPAQKAMIESHLQQGSGMVVDKTPTNAH